MGLRAHISGRELRRVESRVVSTHLYPTITASLACRYLGMTGRLQPTRETEHQAYQQAFSSWKREQLLLNV